MTRLFGAGEGLRTLDPNRLCSTPELYPHPAADSRTCNRASRRLTATVHFCYVQPGRSEQAWLSGLAGSHPNRVHCQRNSKSNTTEVGVCVLLSDLQSAFNDANPDKRVRITVSNTTMEIDPWSEGQPHDDCAGTPKIFACHPCNRSCRPPCMGTTAVLSDSAGPRFLLCGMQVRYGPLDKLQSLRQSVPIIVRRLSTGTEDGPST